MEQKDLVLSAEEYISNYLKENMPKKYVYHDLEHTQNVVNSCRELGLKYFLNDREMELLLVAAWFHDTGYVEGPENHEERGVEKAKAFLDENNIPYTDEEFALIEECIMATKMPQSPKSLLSNIMCDSDLNHLGKDSYWERCVKVRQELMIAKGRVMQEDEWLDFEIDFLDAHTYHTDIAESSWGEQKKQHVKQLRKLKRKLFPTEEDLINQKKKKKKKTKIMPSGADLEINQLNLGRGVETMYRATYRTHVNLSAMADNKANIMLSINAIIISIVLSSLVPQLTENKTLIIPSLILLTTCMLTIVYATLATRPKVTEGKFTREDIEQKRSNLLFFGNFYNMGMEDFHWGMMEMIKDKEFLYSSMTRDLYWLGKVLAQKYKLLSICYGIFMYGLLISVVAFTIAYAI